MNNLKARRLLRSSVFLSIAAFLAACGGGSDSTAINATEFVKRAAAAVAPATGNLSSRSAVAAATGASTAVITNQMLFDFAQATYKDLFPVASAPVTISSLAYEGKVFEVRSYNNGNYLGVSSTNEIWGLGPFTNNVLTQFGSVSDYACQIVPSSCVVQPPIQTNTTYNECIDPGASTLPTGFRSNLVFTYTGLLTGEQTVDTVIDGPGFTFEGQPAIQATNTTTGSNTTNVAGSSITVTTSTKIKTYQQVGTNGLVKTLGALIEATITTPLPSFPGLPSLPPTITNTSSKTVYNPADENTEYTLTLGSSLNKTTSQTTTITSGAGANVPTATTGTLRYTFEAKESITLASGKSYDTCRYKTGNVDGSNATTSWLIVGKGVPARSQSIANGQTQTIELKSGTYNGTAL